MREARKIIEDAGNGKPLGLDGFSEKEAVEVLAILTFVIVENVPSEDCEWATRYLINRWQSSERLDVVAGARYWIATLAFLRDDAFRKIPPVRLQELLDHADRTMLNALFEEWGRGKQQQLADFVRSHSSASSASHSELISWIPKRIDYNCRKERVERIFLLKTYIAIPQPQDTAVDALDGLYWVLQEVEGLRATEMLTELELLQARLKQAGKQDWVLSRKLADLIPKLKT